MLCTFKYLLYPKGNAADTKKHGKQEEAEVDPDDVEEDRDEEDQEDDEED